MMSKYTHWFDFARYTKCSIFSRGGGKENICSHITKGWQTSGLKVVVGGYLQMVHHNFLPSQQQGVWQCCIVRCIMMRSAILVQLRKLHNDANCSPRTPVALRLWKVCRLQFAPFAQLFAAVRVSINVSGSSLLDELFHKPKIESSKYRTKNQIILLTLRPDNESWIFTFHEGLNYRQPLQCLHVIRIKEKNELMCRCGLMRMLKNLNRLQKIFATATARDLPPSHPHFTDWREFWKVATNNCKYYRTLRAQKQGRADALCKNY